MKMQGMRNKAESIATVSTYDLAWRAN